MRRTKTRIPVLLTAVALYLFGSSVFAEGGSLTDDDGVVTEYDRPFNRIISLYPAHTENLVHMGCEDRLLGISTSDTYPASILDKPKLSYRDNPEKFLSFQPDLILTRPMITRAQPELIRKLRGSGITVISLQPTNIPEMLRYWQTLGELCGQPHQARSMVASFQEKAAEMQQRLPKNNSDRPKVYFEAIHAKMKTFAPDSISAYTLKLSGGRNIAHDARGRNNSNIAPYGKERILARGNEIDVFFSQVGRMNRVSIDDIVNEPGFSIIKAVQEGAVYLIDEEIVSRPTMRIFEGVEQMYALLYHNAQQPEHVKQDHN